MAARALRRSARLTAMYTALFGRNYLADVKSGITMTKNSADPYLQLPDGRALVASTFADASGGLSTLAVRRQLVDEQRSNRVSMGDARSVAALSAGPSHASCESVRRRAVRFATRRTCSATGSAPSHTTRWPTLPPISRRRFHERFSRQRARAANGTAIVAIGDLWRVSPQWQVIYGARVEGNTSRKRRRQIRHSLRLSASETTTGRPRWRSVRGSA